MKTIIVNSKGLHILGILCKKKKFKEKKRHGRNKDNRLICANKTLAKKSSGSVVLQRVGIVTESLVLALKK